MSIFSKSTPSASVKVAHLSSDEQLDLTRFEKTLQEYVQSFAKAGMALRAIRDRQLFRTQYESFEAYVHNKWNFTSQHANRLIAAAGVATNLEPTGSPPIAERQVRPLASLAPMDQVAVWTEAVENAGSVEEVTGTDVEEIIERKRKTKKKKPRAARPISIKVPGARVVVTPTKAFSSAEDALIAALDKLRGQSSKAA